jgi:hypothetical protein
VMRSARAIRSTTNSEVTRALRAVATDDAQHHLGRLGSVICHLEGYRQTSF